MADKIDKALPNVVKETVHVESPEEIEIEETKKLQEINVKDGLGIFHRQGFIIFYKS